MHPNFVEAHNNLGYLYLSVERLDDAMQHFKAAIAVDPSFNPALLNLALTLYAQGDGTDALNAVNRAIKQTPSSSRAHYVAGLILFDSTTPNDTTAALEHLMQASREFPLAKVMAAYEMLRLDRPEQAKQTLIHYLKGAPLR